MQGVLVDMEEVGAREENWRLGRDNDGSSNKVINMLKINIAQEFSETPGGRYRNDGEYSGEEFRESMLKEKFLEAWKNHDKLLIELDGGYGYPTSFLEEAFGGLARLYSPEEVGDTLEFVSDDEPSLKDEINEYIKCASIK